MQKERYRFTKNDARRGGQKRAEAMWAEVRALKEKRKGREMSVKEALASLAYDALHLPPIGGCPARHVQEGERAREYLPGTWTPHRRECKARGIAGEPVEEAAPHGMGYSPEDPPSTPPSEEA